MSDLPSPSVLLGLPDSKMISWYPGQSEAFEKMLEYYHSPARFLGVSLPTGSGKSVLSVLLARLSGAKRVCILTATKGLQEQLMADFGKIAVLVKGQNNFPCPLVPYLHADEGPCHEGMSCPHPRSGTCPYRAQLQKAVDSPLVITNYAYYLAQTHFSSGLGDFDLLVCVPGDTKVTLSDGSLKNIKEIVDGKLRLNVKSVDLKTGRVVNSCISGWQMIKCKMRLLRIHTEVGSFRVTENHQVWTNRGYVSAGSLRVGDVVYGNCVESRSAYSRESIRRHGSDARKHREVKSEDFSQSQHSTKESCGLEESYSRRLGKRFATFRGESGLGNNPVQVLQSVTARTDSVLQVVLPQWEENRISGLVGYGRHSRTGVVVYGRRESEQTAQHSEHIDAQFRSGRQSDDFRLAKGRIRGGNIFPIRQATSRYALSEIERNGAQQVILAHSQVYRAWGCLQDGLYHSYSNVSSMRSALPTHEKRGFLFPGVSERVPKRVSDSMEATATRVLGIEEEESPEYVYDITVSETHNFFADGHLVKNCDEGHQAFGAMENHLTIHISRMDVESQGLTFPVLPTPAEPTTVKRRISKKAPITQKTTKDTSADTKAPRIGSGASDDDVESAVPDIWGIWKSWAGCSLPLVESTVARLDKDIHDIRSSGGQPPSSMSKAYRVAKSLFARLTSLYNAQGDWVIQRTAHGYQFTPRWVKSYATMLFGAVPKIVLMSAILSQKTCDYLGVDSGDNRAWLEVGSYFPAKNTPIYHIPTARINYRTDDYGTTIWLSRIDQIISRRLDRKGIIFTVSYDRARLLLANSHYKDIMMSHSTGDVAWVVDKFKKATAPRVLVSPSVTTGWDFPGLDYIIVGKLPYPTSTDPVTQARQGDDKDWGSYLAMDVLVQESGRGTRSSTDKCEVFIIDDSFLWYWKAYKQFAPQWFRDRVRGSLTSVPDPLFQK